MGQDLCPAAGMHPQYFAFFLLIISPKYTAKTALEGFRAWVQVSGFFGLGFGQKWRVHTFSEDLQASP